MSDCEQENETAASPSLANSIDIASMKIFKETYEQASDKNVVASPVGALTLLSLYASAGDGKNREEIITLLGSTDYYKKIFESYSQLTEIFNAMDSNSFVIANKILGPNENRGNDEFYHAVRMYSDEGYIDKSQYEKAVADTKKEWSSSKMSKHPMDPVSESDFDPDSVVALLNTIFFKGQWNVSFDASKTTEEDFYVDRSTTIKKPMMHSLQLLYFHHNQDIGAKMIELKYKESNFSMFIVLPDEVDGLPAVLEMVSERGLLEEVIKLRSQKYSLRVDISLPKFNIWSLLNLKRILVSGIFGSAPKGELCRTRATQEAFIKVDEDGATAGAVIGRIKYPKSIRKSTAPGPTPFKVDRPFLYVILHEDIILFVGTYTH